MSEKSRHTTFLHRIEKGKYHGGNQKLDFSLLTLDSWFAYPGFCQEQSGGTVANNINNDDDVSNIEGCPILWKSANINFRNGIRGSIQSKQQLQSDELSPGSSLGINN